MSNTAYGLSVDAAHAEKLAHFWAEALGQDVAPGANPPFATLAPDGATPRLSIHQVPEPQSVKNRLHLDLISPLFEAEPQRLIVLGASRIRDVTQGFARWTTFADPEGNEFDLITGRDMKGSQGECTRVRANASATRSPGSTEAQELK
ncbi:VOC family protein [Streptomyces chattanoogensis]|uniref:VOC family protein n=1 Tax=Streptomyces chattanoogensis TaxID=66876 RepID=UPI0006B4DBCB|nr:VOC family protein [Streptomyces chattanoogensis]